jgi:hypothetical protein
VLKHDAGRKYEGRNVLNLSSSQYTDRKAINERNPSYACELHLEACYENKFHLLQFIFDETNRRLLRLAVVGISILIFYLL